MESIRYARRLALVACLGPLACTTAPGTGGTQPFDLALQADGAHLADATTLEASSPQPTDAVQIAPEASATEGPFEPATMLAPGLYAGRHKLAVVATVPMLGTPTAVEVTTLYLHTVTHEGGQVRVTNKTCDIRQPKQLGVDTVYTQAFLDAEPVTSMTVTAAGPATGPWSLRFSAVAWVMGAMLADVWTDALPVDKADPRVTDDDQDGHPGVTVKLTGFMQGDLYIVQRNTMAMTGTLSADGKAVGLLGGTVDQSLLGASDELLASFAPSPSTDPDVSKSTFQWLPAGPVKSCQELVKQEQALFGP